MNNHHHLQTPFFIRAIIIALVILLGVIQAHYYFTEHLAIYNIQVRSRSDDPDQMDHIDVFFRSADLPPGTPIILITDGIALMTDYPTLSAVYQRDLEAESAHPAEVNQAWATERVRNIGPNGYAFFIEPNASWSRSVESFLAEHFELDPPQLSPYNAPLERQYALWYARRSVER